MFYKYAWTNRGGIGKKYKIKFRWLLQFSSKGCILISFVLNPLMSGGNKRPYILKQSCSNLNKINASKCTNQNILGEYLPVQGQQYKF